MHKAQALCASAINKQQPFIFLSAQLLEIILNSGCTDHFLPLSAQCNIYKASESG